MPPKAFDLLGALLEARPRALSKAEIRDRLWPETFVTEATLASVVSELRSSLADDPKEPRFVRTVHGHGYAFSGAAREDAIVAPPQPTRPIRPAVIVVAALALLAMGGLGLLARRGGPSVQVTSEPRTVAVLPLEDLSNEPDQAYVVDGLTEALVTRLAESGHSVVSRTSAMRFRASSRPRSEIAKELGADWLVEGSARRAGDVMHVAIRLIDAPAARPLWTRTYECAFGDLPQLPTRVARDLAEASRAGPHASAAVRLASVRAVDPDAYDAYLRGALPAGPRLASSRTAKRSSSCRKPSAGIRATRRPTPNSRTPTSRSATVWAGAAAAPDEQRSRRARPCKALEIEPDLADAHTFLGSVKLYDWDFAGAEREFVRAMELDPSAAAAHGGYSSYLAARGRMDEALAEARRAETLDPLSVRMRRNRGYVLFQARRYDEAIASLQAVVATEPKDNFSRWFLGWAHSLAGRHDEAVAELEQAAKLSDRAPNIVGTLAGALARAGRQSEARSLVAELEETSRRRYVSPAAFINAHAGLDDRDRVFRWLERGFEERINYMVFLNNLETLDPLRGDPRFRDLVKRIGL